MNRKALTILLFTVLTCLVINNIAGFLDGHYKFYYPGQKEKLEQHPVFASLKRIMDFTPYRAVNSLTGLETGYGFFSPNVASDFVVWFTVLDAENHILDSLTFVTTQRTKESFIRMNTAYSMFLDYDEQDPEDFDSKKALLFLKGMARKNLQHYPEAAAIQADLYLYDHPMLSQIKQISDATPALYLYYSKVYARNDFSNWE